MRLWAWPAYCSCSVEGVTKMGRLFTLFAAWLSRAIPSLAVFAGWKTFLGVLVTGLVGVLMFNVAVDLIEAGLSWVLSAMGGVANPGLPESGSITGLAAYLAGHLKVVECIGLVCSVVLLKWMMVKIPFLKW